MTVASRVPADRFQVSCRVIIYHIATILSCFRYNLNGQKVIEKHFVNTITKCPPVTSVVLIWQLSTRLHLKVFLKFIGAETQAELEVKGYQNITLCGASF